MAVKFEFVLNDLDAENLFQLIYDAEHKCDVAIIDERKYSDTNTDDEFVLEVKASRERIEWLKEHKKYIGQIIKRMLEKQTRKDDSSEYDV